ncbi:MAG: hypothetical protein A2070_03445 [Bdellovibrionales bacterium GWC1_52_8]|nr:MAG: hypothetical protein A2Z97_00260 [Bdellovibrionales bacterium GWB1_52_6]OFZ04179.1 MAG: hypothetical protein A2X97_15405 [Bdellovibrionales bacterium GWA1_52_35]OFZ32346.1 MAG: hypothetical protein A2070_03445 [Bdellovibrionales bacterium GWC1_52_8]HCM40524.1 hypothetical protein [Bdellovibrionales bacterium]
MVEKKQEVAEPEVDLASLEQAVQAAADKAERDQSGEEVEERSFELNTRSVVAGSKNAARRATAAFANVWGEMFKALFGKDRVARRMAFLFFLGVIGVVTAFTLTYRRYSKITDLSSLQGTGVEETSKNLSEFIQKQSDHAKKKFATLALGKFTVDLKPVEGIALSRGVLNVAELEITVECDNKETRYYIEDHLTRTRDQVTGVLTSVDREELLTRDGKRKLKKRLLDHLNAWLPAGNKVEDLFISNQLLN